MLNNMGAYADVPGVNLAIGTHDGNANFASAPTVYSGITVGGVVPYVSPPTPVVAGADGKLLIAISVPDGVTVQSGTGGNITCRLNTGTVVVNPLGGAPTSAQTVFPYNIQLEFTTKAKRVVVVGDSISVGVNTYWDVPGLGAAPYYAMGLNHGYAVCTYGVSGARMYDVFDDQQAEMSAATYQAQSQLAAVVRDAVVIIEVGINDVQFAHVAGGVTTYQSFIAMVDKAVTWLRAHGAKAIVFETLAAASAYEGSYGANRVEYCNWIATKPFGIDAVIDRDQLMSTAPRTVGTTLKAAYDSGDGTHPNAVGELVLSEAAFAVISTL
jgi:lysophospholipase L1-like esterase